MATVCSSCGCTLCKLSMRNIPCTPTASAQPGGRFPNSTSRQGKPLSLFLVSRDVPGAAGGAEHTVEDVGLSCRAQQPQRAPCVHPGVLDEPSTSTSTSITPGQGRDFTYLLPEFLCLFVLFSSCGEEEEEEGGASTRTGPATSEPQRQKPFPCSINFIGKCVSLGGGEGHFPAPRVPPRERAR